MANLLESLESAVWRAGTASSMVRRQVNLIDDYIRKEAENRTAQTTPALTNSVNATDPSPSDSNGDNMLWEFPRELMDWPWSFDPFEPLPPGVIG